jgi:cytochrome P450 family 138
MVLMSTTMALDPHAAAPPGPRMPKVVSLGAFLFRRERVMARLRERFGDAYSVDLPVFGRTVIVSSPDLVRQVFQAKPDVLAFGERSPLGKVLGPGSLFAMDGEQHLRERRLILPAFHGERMKGYEQIIEEEALRELAGWPEGQPFETLDSFMRITLNSILRAVFGAEGDDVRELAEILPDLVALGSRLSLLQPLQRDLGRWSPGGRFKRVRARYDAIVDRMIDAHLADPELEQRADTMALLLRAHYEDGSSMSRSAVADELLTLLAAGHETTATSLAWAVERLRRHPAILERLVEEADSGGRKLRIATIHEVQRTRPVIPATGRYALEDFPLGDYVVPKGQQIIVSASQIHRDKRFFDRPLRFEPDRFVDVKPDTYTWVPFGGGTRRCPGAAFAHMEMDIVLRTLLTRFELETTTAPDAKSKDRGIAFAPADGGLAIVRRRDTTVPPGPPAEPLEASVV